jgi:hypothetical protein
MRRAGNHRVRNVSKSNIFLVLCLSITALAQHPSAAPPVPTDRLADTYQIYSLLTPGEVLMDMDQGQPWAINNTTINEDDMNPRLAPDAMLNPPDDNPKAFKEAVRDYYQRRKQRYVLTRRFQLDRPYILLTPDDAANLKASKISPDADSDLQAKYQDYLGITYFSQVYFNTQQNAALVYILDWCGNLCSQATWVYLEKQNGVWVRRSGKAPPQT